MITKEKRRVEMERQKKIDIVLYSDSLRNTLKKMFAKNNLRISDVVRDANEKGMTTITKEKLSRYLNSKVPIHGYPTQVDILWLASRYRVGIKLKVYEQIVDEDVAIANAEVILKNSKR